MTAQERCWGRTSAGERAIAGPTPGRRWPCASRSRQGRLGALHHRRLRGLSGTERTDLQPCIRELLSTVTVVRELTSGDIRETSGKRAKARREFIHSERSLRSLRIIHVDKLNALRCTHGKQTASEGARRVEECARTSPSASARRVKLLPLVADPALGGRARAETAFILNPIALWTRERTKVLHVVVQVRKSTRTCRRLGVFSHRAGARGR